LKFGKSKATQMFLIAVAFALLLAGCSSGNKDSSSSADQATPPASSAAAQDTQAASSPASDAIDTSKEVHLVGYLLGEAPKGMPAVVDELNKRMKADINATVEFRYIGWGDFNSKYPLVLASGEDADFIFTADWAFYQQEADKGAFLELSDDMLNTYMPLHMKNVSPDILKGTKIAGKQYMVGTTSPDRKVGVVLIRKDLREKYGLPEIKRFTDIEPYLDAVKQHESGMIPMNLDATYDLGAPYGALLREKTDYINLENTTKATLAYKMDDPSGALTEWLSGDLLSLQKEVAATMKDWYGKGYMNKDVYANKIRSKDVICDGKTGVAFGNSVDIQATIASCESKGIETELIPVFSPQGHEVANSPLNNGVAVVASSKNPERALMFLDRIMEDPSYDYLVYFGLEGKNYSITSDGKIGLPEGVTASTNDYPADAAGFWFTNKDLFKPMEDWTPEFIDLKEHLKTALVNPVYNTFSFVQDNVKAQVANIAQVDTQYMNPIRIGAVKDVDAAFQTYLDKLKAAGQEEMLAELRKQAQAFLASQQ